MKSQPGASLIYQIILILLAAPLITPTAMCEQSVWDCPQCGRPGNTGNFCGRCGHPAPSPEPSVPASTPGKAVTLAPELKPLQITDINYYGLWNEPGQVEIQYSGGVKPVYVTAYHYFNSDHNAGITNCFELKGYESDDCLYLDDLIPTYRYWIKLVDAQNTVLWKEYTVPDASDSRIKERLKKLYDMPDLKVKLMAEDIFYYCPGDKTPRKNMNRYTSEQIMDKYPYIEIRCITQAFKDTWVVEACYFGAIVLPNGDVFACGGDSELLYPNGGEKFLYLPVNWNEITDAYGYIPKGKYTFVFGFHDKIMIQKRFTIQ